MEGREDPTQPGSWRPPPRCPHEVAWLVPWRLQTASKIGQDSLLEPQLFCGSHPVCVLRLRVGLGF